MSTNETIHEVVYQGTIEHTVRVLAEDYDQAIERTANPSPRLCATCSSDQVTYTNVLWNEWSIAAVYGTDGDEITDVTDQSVHAELERTRSSLAKERANVRELKARLNSVQYRPNPPL